MSWFWRRNGDSIHMCILCSFFVANEENSFLSQITSGQKWQEYSSHTYRLSSYTSRPYLAPARVTVFWRSIMLLQARSMWYKALIQKLPTHQKGIIDSPECLLCRTYIEDMDHLLVTCSVRWAIWVSALSIYYPDLSFVPSDILAAIQLSPTPSAILNQKRIYTILSTIQWCIWKAYWILWWTNSLSVHLPFSRRLSPTLVCSFLLRWTMGAE
jgi:hypothetical protein